MEVLTPEQLLRKYVGKDPEDIELLEEFEDLKGSGKEISEEEKEKRREELEDMSSEELREVFGLT